MEGCHKVTAAGQARSNPSHLPNPNFVNFAPPPPLPKKTKQQQQQKTHRNHIHSTPHRIHPSYTIHSTHYIPNSLQTFPHFLPCIGCQEHPGTRWNLTGSRRWVEKTRSNVGQLLHRNTAIKRQLLPSTSSHWKSKFCQLQSQLILTTFNYASQQNGYRAKHIPLCVRTTP